MSAPEISVLLPTYNYASYLPEAIESVLAQDFRDFELLIIDDCSSDNTAAVVKPYCADGRVRFEVNLAAAKKAGLTLSSELLKVARAVRRNP